MKVADLKKELNHFNDTANVTVSLKGAEYRFEVDSVKYTSFSEPLLEPSDAANFEDICGMAKECMEENEKYLKPEERELLLDFLIGAEKLKRRAI